MRVVLTGGGTGGHVYPALSVAQCLQGHDLLYVGSADGPEATIVPRAGLEFRPVPARKLGRSPSPAVIGALAVSAWGIARGMALLRAWRPDVVLGTGGFASVGIMFGAAALRIPTVIHEANAVPGRVNLLLAKICTRVAVTYPETQATFPTHKTTCTGMPVRLDLHQANPEAARRGYGLSVERPVLLVSGGSGGAQSLNRAVVAALPQLAEMAVQVVHQTGRGLYEAVVREAPPREGFYQPLAYVDDMPGLLAAADLIVCRGGSSTLAEVTALGLPAVVVPYPFAVADHQTANARAMAAAGAAVVVPDSEFDGQRLAAEVSSLLEDAPRRARMREASRSLGRPNAAGDLAELILETARLRNGRQRTR